MHRLVIVSGPNRGSSFSLIDGENTIGRQMDNQIVLSSGKVSKRHCALLVTPKEIFLRDEGSTNGTFVNGTLVRKIPLKSGDQIGIGEFVLELSSPPQQAVMIRNEGAGEFPVGTGSAGIMTSAGSAALSGGPAQVEPQAEEPQDLPGKLKFQFEWKLMPFFYGVFMKNEYRSIVAVFFSVLTLISVVGSVMPTMDLAKKSIQREGMLRAKVLAREVADRFAPAIANRTESQIDLSFLTSEDSVKLVVITDPNLQIIAPQSRINQIFGGGREAVFATAIVKEFKEGREKGYGALLGDTTAVYAEPLKTTDSRTMRSRFAAMVIVSIDFSANLLDEAGWGVAYGVGFVIAGLMATLVYFILFRLTLKPFQVLNDDLDQVLRGELPKVTHEFKIEELNPLWDNINATIQRLPKSGVSSDFGGGETVTNWDQEISTIRSLCEAANLGFVAFDHSLNLVGMNAQFEEISGIRFDAIGKSIEDAARDQSLISLSKDLMEKVDASTSRNATDDFEFSGVLYQVFANGIGPIAQTGLVMTFKKKE